jgi:hypothetical protein
LRWWQTWQKRSVVLSISQRIGTMLGDPISVRVSHSIQISFQIVLPRFWSKIIIVSLQLKNQKEKYVSWALEPKMDPKLHKLHLVWLGPPWPLRFFHSSIPMQTSELLYHVIPISPLSLV